jgi:hypothetical protein
MIVVNKLRACAECLRCIPVFRRSLEHTRRKLGAVVRKMIRIGIERRRHKICCQHKISKNYIIKLFFF